MSESIVVGDNVIGSDMAGDCCNKDIMRKGGVIGHDSNKCSRG